MSSSSRRRPSDYGGDDRRDFRSELEDEDLEDEELGFEDILEGDPDEVLLDDDDLGDDELDDCDELDGEDPRSGSRRG